MRSKVLVFLFVGASIFIESSLNLILFGEEDCALVINEVNTASPENVKKEENVQGFKIIGISVDAAATANNQKMSVD